MAIQSHLVDETGHGNRFLSQTLQPSQEVDQRNSSLTFYPQAPKGYPRPEPKTSTGQQQVPQIMITDAGHR